jgi:hypothetical protein
VVAEVLPSWCVGAGPSRGWLRSRPLSLFRPAVVARKEGGGCAGELSTSLSSSAALGVAPRLKPVVFFFPAEVARERT